MCPRTSRWSRSSHRPATRSPSPGAAGSTPHCSTGSSASSATTGTRAPGRLMPRAYHQMHKHLLDALLASIYVEYDDI